MTKPPICALKRENLLLLQEKKQERHRQASESAQSYQCLGFRYFESIVVNLASCEISVFLASFCTRAGCFELYVVGNRGYRGYRFSHVKAHITSAFRKDSNKPTVLYGNLLACWETFQVFIVIH